MADEFTKAALYGIRTFNKKVKEKIGMMKLIELLNEYEEAVNTHYHYYWGIDGDYISSDVSGTDHTLDKDEASIIIKSKEYGFIKWLVENDKIDLEKFPQIMEYSDYESLLMLLSISSSPIEDLISYLK